MLGRTRAELMQSMSYRELREQIAFDRLEPLPDSWSQTGLLAALLYNPWAKGPAKSPEDFIPSKPAPAREQTPEEASAIFAAIAEAMTARNMVQRG